MFADELRKSSNDKNRLLMSIRAACKVRSGKGEYSCKVEETWILHEKWPSTLLILEREGLVVQNEKIFWH